MESAQGKGVREGQAPQTSREINSQPPSNEGGNMEQEEEGKKTQA
jgi:hypothetical protein